MGDGDAKRPPSTEALSEAFERTVEEGERRLHRSWPALLATGVVGGIDIGFGLLALFVVHHETGNSLLAALAFGIGFISLMLAHSELFTENFLIPISTVVAKRATAVDLLRLWGGTLAMNLVGGWLFMWLIVVAHPEIRTTMVELGSRYIEFGVGARTVATGILAGAVITLMTWMDHSTDSVPAALTVAVMTAFILVATELTHVVVISLEMFAALQSGAPFGYAEWAGVFGWAVLWNSVGGIALVTVLRLIQVGRAKIRDEQRG